MNEFDNRQQRNGYFPEEEEISLQDFIWVLYRHRRLILITFLVIFAGTVYYTFTAQPIYETSTTIMIQNEQKEMSEIFGSPAMSDQKTLNNEIQYLKSRTLAEDVIKNLENTKYADSLFVLGTAGEVESNFLSELKNLPSTVLGWMTGSEEEDAETYEERIRRLSQKLRGWITVEPVRETDVIKIKVQAPARREAVLTTNTIADEYHKQNLKAARGEISEVKEFLKEQLDQVRENLFEAEVDLKKYQQQSEAIAMDQATEKLVDQAAEFKSLYNNTIAEKQAIQTRINYLEGQLSQREKQSLEDITGTTSPFIKSLRDTLASKQVQLAVMQTDPNIPPDHEAYQRVKQHIEDLRKQLREETEKLLQRGIQVSDPLAQSQELVGKILELKGKGVSLKSKEKYLGQLVEKYNEKIESLPEKNLQLARLKRDQQVNEKVFMLMKTKYEETRIKEAGQIGNVRIVDPAVPPKSPIKPNKKLNLLLGLFLGGGLGIGLSFVLEYLDNTVKTVEDIEHLGLKVVGTVPSIETEKEEENGRLGEAGRIEQRLVTHLDPKSPASEAYRSLRTNLQFINPDLTPTNMLVTSPGPGEGKSTTTANLAITLAQVGYRTLIVDSDLRRPVIHKIFGCRRTPGLTDVLVQEKSADEVIARTEVENLSVLPCSQLPPDPSELLASGRMRELIKELSEKYDRIIYDSPPLIVVTDASVLTTEVDSTLLVVMSGGTDRRALERASQQLNDIGGHLSGALLNNVKPDNVYGSHYYYYHYYYDQHDGEGERKRRRRSHS